MATGNTLSYSVLHGSDVTYDFTCTPCERKGKTAEATSYCTRCWEYFCETCIDFHNNFPALSDHLDKVLDESEMKKRGPQKVRVQLTEKCERHDGKVVELYCSDHDEVGCTTCTALNHRNCSDVQYIPVIARGCGKRIQIRPVQDTMERMKETLQDIVKLRSEQKASLSEEKERVLTTIAQFRDKLNAAIDKVQEATITELEARHNAMIARFDEDLETCGKSLESMERLLKQLDSADASNEVQTFVTVKVSKRVTEDASKLHRDLIAAAEPNDIKFSIDESIMDWLNSLKTLGNFYYEPKLIETGNTKIITFHVKGDPVTIGKVSCCQRPDGMVLVVDSNNQKLKLVNPTRDGVVEFCDLSSFPRAVCTISQREAAVTLENHTVQIIAMSAGDRKLVPTSTIDLSHPAFGIACLNNELFISDGAKNIFVYLTSGEYQRTISVDENGQDLFSRVGHFAASGKSSELYVVDSERGLMKMSSRGTPFWSFTDPGLSAPHSVTVDKDDNVFVCGNWSHNVVQVSPCDGGKIGELLRTSDGLKYPTTVCYERFKNKLVVGMGARGYLKVFDLE